MSELSCVSASQRTPRELVDLFARCFEGYVVPIHFTLETFLSRMRIDLVDFTRSMIVRRGDLDVAVAFLSPRGGELRVAAMGVAKEARGQQVGAWLLQQIFERAHERTIELEVLTGNEPAVALYEKSGFVRLERLLGYLAQSPAGEESSSLAQIPLDRAARAAMLHGDEDLPWQCAGPTLLSLAHPCSAWQLAASSLILGDQSADELRILSILTQRGQRRTGQAARLMRALFAQFPGRTWFVPPIVPERYDALFRGLGMAEHPLSQWRMRRDLPGREL